MFIKRKLSIILSLILSMFLLQGCVESTTTSTTNTTNKDSAYYQQKLHDAKEIKVEKSLNPLRKGYNIYVDDEEVATVTGKYISALGETLTLEDENGTVLSKENQEKRWGVKWTRKANVRDKDDNVTGYMGEEIITNITNIGYTFHFYDKNEKELGKTSQVVFSLMDSFNFLDNDKNKDYEITKNISLITSYTMKINDTDSDIPLYDAILMVCIQDSIKSAEDD